MPFVYRQPQPVWGYHGRGVHRIVGNVFLITCLLQINDFLSHDRLCIGNYANDQMIESHLIAIRGWLKTDLNTAADVATCNAHVLSRGTQLMVDSISYWG